MAPIKATHLESHANRGFYLAFIKYLGPKMLIKHHIFYALLCYVSIRLITFLIYLIPLILNQLTSLCQIQT